MKKLLINKNIIVIFSYAVMFIFLYMLTVVYNSVDMDYWARLLQGNSFWLTGHILKIDIFSYTHTHFWLDHEWGASIIFSLVQKAGYGFVLFFKALIVFLTFFFIFKTIRLRYVYTNTLLDILYFLFAAFAMPTITQSWLRCHFFTFLFFALSLFIMEKARLKQNYKLLFILPVLMIFWVNIHGGCVALLGLLGIYAFGEFLNKKPFKFYIFALLLCLAVMFINPYGFDYVKFIFMASTMTRPFVTEWISPFFHQDRTFFIPFKIFYVINILLLLFSVKYLKKDYTKYIILFVCAYLSFRYVKNTPFFVIASMIFLYEEVYVIFKKVFSKDNYIFLNYSISLLLLIISLYIIKLNIFNVFFPDISQQPVAVVSFIKNNDLKGNILAPFDMGSYISYKLYPNNLIYMDGRYEEVYYKDTKDLLDKFYNVSENWDDILNTQYRHDYIIIPSDALLNDYISGNTDYKLIYTDNNNYLYARKGLEKEIYKLGKKNSGFDAYLHAFDTVVKFK